MYNYWQVYFSSETLLACHIDYTLNFVKTGQFQLKL